MFLTGFWQTAFWDGITRYFPLDFPNVESVLRVPSGHSVMISFQQHGLSLRSSKCLYDRVTVEVPGSPVLGREYCGHTKSTLPQFMEHVAFVVITYFSLGNLSHSNTGFKLQYSFHEYPARIDFISDLDKFDCSGRYWPQFRHHFPCNLETNCVGGEDETECPYTSMQTCGQDHQAVAGFCFSDGRFGPSSWSEASSYCADHGARLPSLNTPEKWEGFRDLLSYKEGETVFIGLLNARSRRSNM